MTRLFYVDESRDRGKNGHHFHVGLLAEGRRVAAAETALDEIVEQAWDDGITSWNSELHGAHIFQGLKEWARGSNDQRAAVYEAALSVVVQENIEVIARGVGLSQFEKRYPGGDPYRWGFSNLLERLNERLHTLDAFGLVIADQQHEYRELLQRDVADGKHFGTGGYRSQRLARVLDTAHFVDSKLSRMVQLANLAAFVLRRRATIPTEHDLRTEALMARLHALVVQGIPAPTGQYFTIR